MSIPEAVVEAAAVHRELAKNGWAEDTAKARVRRVILALKKEMPNDALGAACVAFFGEKWSFAEVEAMRDAIADFLNHVAGDAP